MGEDYKAKIEVTLGNDNMADMTLNGSINDLLNLMADVMAQTIVDFSDTKNEAEKAMEKVRYSIPIDPTSRVSSCRGLAARW